MFNSSCLNISSVFVGPGGQFPNFSSCFTAFEGTGVAAIQIQTCGGGFTEISDYTFTDANYPGGVFISIMMNPQDLVFLDTYSPFNYNGSGDISFYLYNCSITYSYSSNKNLFDGSQISDPVDAGYFVVMYNTSIYDTTGYSLDNNYIYYSPTGSNFDNNFLEAYNCNFSLSDNPNGGLYGMQLVVDGCQFYGGGPHTVNIFYLDGWGGLQNTGFEMNVSGTGANITFNLTNISEGQNVISGIYNSEVTLNITIHPQVTWIGGNNYNYGDNPWIITSTDTNIFSVGIGNDGMLTNFINTAVTYVNMYPNNNYVNRGTNTVTASLPALIPVGAKIGIINQNTGAIKTGQSSGQTQQYLSSTTTAGSGHYLQTGGQGTAFTLLCITTNEAFLVIDALGTPTVH